MLKLDYRFVSLSAPTGDYIGFFSESVFAYAKAGFFVGGFYGTN